MDLIDIVERNSWQEDSEAFRRHSVKLKVVTLRKAGMKIKQIAAACNLSRTTVIAVSKAYDKGGWQAILPKRIGRPEGAGQAITSTRQYEILRMIVEKTPEQLSIGGRLWTTAAVRKLVFDSYGIALTSRAILNYLFRWGVTNDCRSYKHRSDMNDQQARWLKEAYDTLRTKAYLEQRTIYFLNHIMFDKCKQHPAIESDTVWSAGAADVKEKSFVLLRAISSKGVILWKVYPGKFTTPVLIDFCDQLCREHASKLLMVSTSSVQTKSVRFGNWLAKKKEKIVLDYMPA